MSYFNEVEFDLRDDPTEHRLPKEKWAINTEAMPNIIQEIREVFALIKAGKGRPFGVAYAIDPSRFASPVESALRTLQQSPSIDTMRDFLQVAEQDLGTAAKNHLKGLLNKAIKENKDE